VAMAKLQDLFTQARREQGGSGMGFLGRNKPTSKAHAAALVVAFSQVTAGNAEAALKAGADGLLFRWGGKGSASLETIKEEIDAAKTVNDQVVTGLEIVAGWDKLDRDSLTEIKDQGIHYIIVPFNAPARLLALETKDIEKIVVVPMRRDDFYPLYIRNLSAFDGIAGVVLDFGLNSTLGALTIEEALNYRAVREAIRFPAFIHVTSNLKEHEAYALLTVGIQAVVLTASETEETTQTEIKALREVLEKVHQEDKDKDKNSPSVPPQARK
jgi:hypothetical protein